MKIRKEMKIKRKLKQESKNFKAEEIKQNKKYRDLLKERRRVRIRKR
jgi:hypothetical protein